MRICHLSSGHSPDDDRIFYKEVRSLAKIYKDVWIISPYPEHTPHNKYGIKFISVPSFKGWIGRFRNMRSLYEAALNLKADIYHCHEPESLLVGLKLKRELGCKVIFDSHEMYSATLAKRFPAFFHNQVMATYKIFERTKIKQCDFAIGATWAISEYLSKTISESRTETILNCPLPEIFGELIEREWNDETIICHDGCLPFSRGLKTMVRAIEIVSKKYSVKLRIIGDVFGREREWLESYANLYNMNGIIERTGWLDYTKVGAALSSCHIGLIALEKIPNHIIAAPNKLFNYMYFGLPVVAPDHCTCIKYLLEKETCGLLADSKSAESYAAAIIDLIENRNKAHTMGMNARKATMNKYIWPVMETKLLKIYSQLT